MAAITEAINYFANNSCEQISYACGCMGRWLLTFYYEQEAREHALFLDLQRLISSESAPKAPERYAEIKATIIRLHALFPQEKAIAHHRKRLPPQLSASLKNIHQQTESERQQELIAILVAKWEFGISFTTSLSDKSWRDVQKQAMRINNRLVEHHSSLLPAAHRYIDFLCGPSLYLRVRSNNNHEELTQLVIPLMQLKNQLPSEQDLYAYLKSVPQQVERDDNAIFGSYLFIKLYDEFQEKHPNYHYAILYSIIFLEFNKRVYQDHQINVLLKALQNGLRQLDIPSLNNIAKNFIARQEILDGRSRLAVLQLIDNFLTPLVEKKTV